MSAEILDAVRAHYTAEFATGDPHEASVTFLGTDPMRVLRYVGPGQLVRYASLGCSAHPMGDPSALVPDPDGPRAELVVEVEPVTDTRTDGIVRALAVLASTPAVEGVVLQDGALLDVGEPLWPGAPFTSVVLQQSSLPDLPVTGGSPVTFLRAVPVTHNEAAWARLRGASELASAWAEAGIDVRDPSRPAVSAVG